MKAIKYTLLIGAVFAFWHKGFASLPQAATGITYKVTPADTTSSAKPILGKYNIYSGIPSMYIGHFELKEGGNYIVALSSDENSYATGTYTYNSTSSTIEWKTGFFWQKKWGGKITIASGNAIHIEFNRVTYANSDK